MTHGTKIEWTHIPGFKGETWNPVRAEDFFTGKTGWHCEHVTEACRNCYAEARNLNARNLAFGTGLPYKPGHRADVEIALHEPTLQAPLRWRKPRAVFVCSMTDLFGDWVTDAMLDKIFAVMALCPQHIFIVLTKRPERMRAYITGTSDRYRLAENERERRGIISFPKRSWPPPNVWLGVSVCDQADADAFVPPLLDTPAAKRFASYEPALGPVDWTRIDDGERDGLHLTFDALTGLASDQHDTISGIFDNPDPRLDWITAGGESGPNARPAHPDWFRQTRDQCADAGVPFFFKQWGEWAANVGAVDGWTIDDDPEVSRFDHREWEGDHWGETFRPMWCDFLDGNYDEEQCVSRIGKTRAGRTLDGVLHDGFPL